MANPCSQGPLALHKLELVAQVEVSVPGKNCRHVRVNRNLAALKTRKAKREPDQPLVIEGPKQNRARFPGSNQEKHRDRIAIVTAPDFFLDIGYLTQVFDGFRISDHYCGLGKDVAHG